MTRGRTYRSGSRRLRGAAGLSLVELLVVLGIIGLISAVLVPAAIQNGWFASSKSSLAARELFTLLKAASVYAGTYNIETALAYGGRYVIDSESDERVPVIDRLILARRLKREEVNVLRENGHALAVTSGDEYYVPVLGPEGVFRPMPNQSCVLPDLFEVVDVGSGTPNYVSARGLRGILLFDPSDNAFVEPLFDTDLGEYLDYADDLEYVEDDLTRPASFPAHVFKPDGSMRVDQDFARQRFRIRAGVMPDQSATDRFFPDLSEFPLNFEPINIVFNEFDGTTPLTTDTFYSTDPDDILRDDEGNEILDENGLPIRPIADVDAELEFFVATGRVRLVE